MGSSGRQPRSPAFQWYPADFRANSRTQRFTALEAGMFHLLLDEQWLEGPLPNDPLILAYLCGMAPEAFSAAWPRVAPCFPAQPDGRLASPRLERERELQAKFSEERRQSGLTGNAKRWGGDRSAMAKGSLSDGSGIANDRSPVPTPHTPYPSPHTPDPVERAPSARKRRGTASEPTPKARRATNQYEAAWLDAWAFHRPMLDPYELTPKDARELAAAGAKHGPQKLAERIQALFSSPDPWIQQNASPAVLMSKWSQLGIGPIGGRVMSATELATQQVLRELGEHA